MFLECCSPRPRVRGAPDHRIVGRKPWWLRDPPPQAAPAAEQGVGGRGGGASSAAAEGGGHCGSALREGALRQRAAGSARRDRPLPRCGGLGAQPRSPPTPCPPIPPSGVPGEPPAPRSLVLCVCVPACPRLRRCARVCVYGTPAASHPLQPCARAGVLAGWRVCWGGQQVPGLSLSLLGLSGGVRVGVCGRGLSRRLSALLGPGVARRRCVRGSEPPSTSPGFWVCIAEPAGGGGRGRKCPRVACVCLCVGREEEGASARAPRPRWIREPSPGLRPAASAAQPPRERAGRAGQGMQPPQPPQPERGAA